MTDLFTNRPFCLIKRNSDSQILYLSGKINFYDYLNQIPRKKGQAESGKETFDNLAILPFRQIEERGFVARHHDEKIICLEVATQQYLQLEQFLSTVEDQTITLKDDGNFFPSDLAYAAKIQRIIDQEIRYGEGCNFVVPRRFRAKINNFNLQQALATFKHLLLNEYGVYWSFLFYTGKQYFIGATPERHISYNQGIVKMNPISGTLRKSGYDLNNIKAGLLDFLKDQKETFELLMVTDEELKMMAQICSKGGQVVGPMLKEMSKLIHSEYALVGTSDQDIIDILRSSMYAATVIGSPIENACKVIYRHDQESRRYYGSAFALIGRDEKGADTLDSPITIRMAEIDLDGNLEIAAGATIVYDSIPKEETAETTAKVSALLTAFGINQQNESQSYKLAENLYNEDVMIALLARNAKLSRFWIEDQSIGNNIEQKMANKKITIIDNQDDFTKMLAHIITAQGAKVKIVNYNQYDLAKDQSDLVVIGPGPGNPNDKTQAKMLKLSQICQSLIKIKKPLFCVCLGHQILCKELGFEIIQKPTPLQGAQKLIDLWNKKEYVGFYNAFVAKNKINNLNLEIKADPTTNEIHALRGKYFTSLQFHPESILTTNGFTIIQDILNHLLAT